MVVESKNRPSRETFLGEVLCAAGICDADQIALALDEQRITGERLGDILVRLGIADARAVNRELAVRQGIQEWDPVAEPADPVLLKSFPADLLVGYGLVPIRRHGSELVAATPRAADALVRFNLERECRSRIHLLYVPEQTVQAILTAHLGSQVVAGGGEVPLSLAPGDLNEAVVSELVDALFRRAVAEEVSDLHIEPEERVLRIRARIDGTLRHFMTLSRTLHAPIVARIKIMADLDITENRLPQDGKIVIVAKNEGGKIRAGVSVRVSTFLTSEGEKVVCRLLQPARMVVDLQSLGIMGKNLERVQRTMQSPHGMVLVSGPTGSGKTTTLYSLISKLNPANKHIITLEDPIEVDLPMIRQSQIHARAGLTFASGLRAILRQDPDVILVGEVRDAETAEIALRAALTGHLVLSTIHTNDSISVVARLRQFDIDPFLISSALLLAMAQRLVRRICPHCKVGCEPDVTLFGYFAAADLEGMRFWHGAGCERCDHSGYRGRIGIHEMFPINRAIRDAIQRRVDGDELASLARQAGFRTLKEDGLEKVREGLTTLEEVVRVTVEKE